MTVTNGVRSPASQLMDEAIELAIEERSPFPSRALFLDADVPPEYKDPAMRRVAKEGCSVVLVSPDFSTRVLSPEEILGEDCDAPDA